jgi:CheY-like chemotaxis protein
MMGAASKAKAAVILLAEDDRGDQELTRRALEGGKIRNELRVVEDGEEALAYLYRRGKYKDPATSPRPDLLLLDLNLPRVDGRQVLEKVRSDSRLRRMAVVVLTTSRQEEDVLRSYELGCNSFITKPVGMDQFIQVIQALEEYWFQIVVLPPKME